MTDIDAPHSANAAGPRDNVRAFVDWVRDSALPVWLARGVDHRHGAFYERITFAGTPISMALRTMVQARQIYVFSRAATLGWSDAGLDAAIQAMERMRRTFGRRLGEPLIIPFSATPSGEANDWRADAYSYAFVLLSIGALFEATGEPTLPRLAEQVTAALDRQFADRTYGGVIDSVPLLPRAPAKRQNTHMHLLEAYLALARVLPDQGYSRRVDGLANLFLERLFDRHRQIVVEYFDRDWTCYKSERVFEPGHHYEWLWLSADARAGDHEDWIRTQQAIRARADRSRSPATGLLYNEVGGDGHISDGAHRLWPHAEAIKAAVVAYRRGEDDALARAEQWAAVLRLHFLDRPLVGGWMDRLDPTLAPAIDHIPASSLYHLTLAASEAQTLLDEPADAPLDEPGRAA